jgi:hypothetical protein
MSDSINMPRPGQALSLTQLRRMALLASRTASGGPPSGLESFTGGGGTASGQRMRNRFLIQLTAVCTDGSQTVFPPAYSWQEVIYVNGVYVLPSDGRRGGFGTPLLSTDPATFPAQEMNGSGNATITAGSVSRVYEAWIAADGSCVEFDSSGAAFSGASVPILADTISAGAVTTLRFGATTFDTGGYISGNSFLIPSGYFLCGFSVQSQALSGGVPDTDKVWVSASAMISGSRTFSISPVIDNVAGATVWNFLALGNDGPNAGFVYTIIGAGPISLSVLAGNAWIQKLG